MLFLPIVPTVVVVACRTIRRGHFQVAFHLRQGRVAAFVARGGVVGTRGPVATTADEEMIKEIQGDDTDHKDDRGKQIRSIEKPTCFFTRCIRFRVIVADVNRWA